MDADLSARVQRLEDMEEIRRLKHQYARTCDLGADPDELLRLYAPDGDVAWRSNVFGEHLGHDAIHSWFAKVPEKMSWAAHFMVNPVIDVDPDGIVAYGRWDLLELATMSALDGGSERDAVVMTGWYEDVFCKVDGSWRFLRIQIDLQQISALDRGWVRQPCRGGDPTSVAAGRALR